MIQDSNSVVQEVASDKTAKVRHSPEDIKHNMKCLVMMDAIWIMGSADLTIASQPLWKYLKATNTQIGLIGSLGMLALIGAFLSPFISSRLPIKKLYLLITNIPYIGAWGLMGLVIVLSHQLGLSIPALLSAVIILNAANFFFGGFVSLPHQEYVAACIPMSHRGRMNGYGGSIGSALAMVSALIGGAILLRVARPMSYGWLFIMTWFICQAGYVLAMFGREIPVDVDNVPKAWSRQMVVAAWNDKPFLNVLLLYMLYLVVFMPAFNTYITQYGLRELRMIDASAATIALIMQIIRITLGIPIGHWVDSFSPKRVVQVLPLFGCVTLLPVVFVHSQYAVYVTMGLVSLFIAALYASFWALLYGIPAPENRSGHFSVQIILSTFAFSLGPALTGYLCDHTSYRAVFTIVAATALGLAWLAKRMLSALSINAADYD